MFNILKNIIGNKNLVDMPVYYYVIMANNLNSI